MELSPFPYFGPLEPHQVSGRSDLIADITERITARRVTALIGPRRFGKTSLLRRVADDIEAAGASVLWFDFYEVSSMADIAIRIDEGLANTSVPLGDMLRKVSVGMNINLGVVRLNLTGPAKSRPDPVALVHGQLQMIKELSKRLSLTIIFDEFSSISGVAGAAGILRTHLQHHYQDIGLVFAGSEPSMMIALFSLQSQPFYGQADLVQVGPFTGAEVLQIVNDGFAATGRQAGDLSTSIFAFTGGHPQRTMQLADTAWRLTKPGETASLETWEQTVIDARRSVHPSSERMYSSLPAGEKSVLRIVASGGSIFGSAADLLGLSNGSAQNARDKLMDGGQLSKNDDGSFALVDPLFADWLRNTVPV